MLPIKLLIVITHFLFLIEPSFSYTSYEDRVDNIEKQLKTFLQTNTKSNNNIFAKFINENENIGEKKDGIEIKPKSNLEIPLESPSESLKHIQLMIQIIQDAQKSNKKSGSTEDDSNPKLRSNILGVLKNEIQRVQSASESENKSQSIKIRELADFEWWNKFSVTVGFVTVLAVLVLFIAVSNF